MLEYITFSEGGRAETRTCADEHSPLVATGSGALTEGSQ